MYKVKKCNLILEYDYGYAKAFSYDNLILDFKYDELGCICSFNYNLLNHSKTTSCHYTKAINAFCKKLNMHDNNIKNFYNAIKAIQKNNPVNLAKLQGLIGGNNGRYNSYKIDGVLYVSYNYTDQP